MNVAAKSQTHRQHPPGSFVDLSALRRLRECEQVAAVCYRLGRDGIEFLLVQTRGSARWTFPKGGVEPGLTHAEAAALEAFEEAGVHGRIEESAFAQYVRSRKARSSSPPKKAISAHICEVLWHGPPEESRRNPRWFSPEMAKKRLRQDRSKNFGAELAHVVDLAVARIWRERRHRSAAVDGLQSVRFEAVEEGRGLNRTQLAWLSWQIRRPKPGVQPSSAIEFNDSPRLSKVLQFALPSGVPQNRGLLEGSLADSIPGNETGLDQATQLQKSIGISDCSVKPPRHAERACDSSPRARTRKGKNSRLRGSSSTKR